MIILWQTIKINFFVFTYKIIRNRKRLTSIAINYIYALKLEIGNFKTVPLIIASFQIIEKVIAILVLYLDLYGTSWDVQESPRTSREFLGQRLLKLWPGHSGMAQVNMTQAGTISYYSRRIKF